MGNEPEQIVEFNCNGGSASLFDEEADEIIWSMDLSYSDDVEKKLYELLTLMTNKKTSCTIVFPGIGKITNTKETPGEQKTKKWKPNDWRIQ